MGLFTRVARGNCPKCHQKAARRSHRVGPLERFVLSAVAVRPYRCLGCDTRFYRYDRSASRTSLGQATAKQ